VSGGRLEAVHVVAGVISDAAGRVLLTQRPAGGHLAGLWELPGGKLEPGEGRAAGLARELREELGIAVEAAEPLIRVRHRYPEREVLLDVWEVRRWSGTPRGLEGQPLRWVAREDLAGTDLPPADRPVVQALRLPDLMLITPEPGSDPGAFLSGLERALARGVGLVQLRAKALDGRSLVALARAARALCHGHGARLVMNADPALAEEAGADGVHLTEARLRALDGRPLPEPHLVGASCHDASSLAHAVAIGADYAVLSPVRPTPSHPQAAPLGWARFEALVAGLPLPVYALGGIGPEDLAAARAAGARGVAAIRALWGGA